MGNVLVHVHAQAQRRCRRDVGRSALLTYYVLSHYHSPRISLSGSGVVRWKCRAGQSRGRGCNPASCVGCEPRRACERRAAAASRQVALAAAKFARLWILDWTLVS